MKGRLTRERDESALDCTCNFCVTGERDGLGHDDGPTCVMCSDEKRAGPCFGPGRCFLEKVLPEYADDEYNGRIPW